MALIYWMPKYNTGIEIIDQQHRLLADLVNELQKNQENGNDRQKSIKIINKIQMYAASHFAREEHLFDVHGYPDMDDHLQEHDYFEDMLVQFEDAFKAGRQDLNDSTLDFFSDWLINHINGSDQEYVPFLKGKGVS
ncbi:MAG: bacteriohemerythrin [Desulfocapsaceae bacterium]|nr:bacteriohemerythrin [Desulfocapsaceae bacterium]